MDIRLCLAVRRQLNVGVALDVVLFVQYRIFPSYKQDCFMGVQFSHLVNGHQVAARLLEVGRAGAAATLRLPPCAGGDGLLAQQLHDKLQRSRLVAAAEEQQRVMR